MKILFEEGFLKDVSKIKDKKLSGRIDGIICKIKMAEDLQEISGVKKLKGFQTYYRIRIGDYRIGLELSDNSVIFSCFAHRKDIYKYFP